MQEFPWQGGGWDAFSCGNSRNSRLNFRIMFHRFLAILCLMVGLSQSLHAQVPNAPSNAQAVIGAQNDTSKLWSVPLSWRDNSNNEDGFAILLKLSSTNYDILGTVAANTTSVTLNNALANGDSAVYAILSFIGDSNNFNNWRYSGILDFPLVRGPDQLLKFGSGATRGIALSGVSLEVTNPGNVTNYAATGLPAWLSLNSSTGTLNGTPPTAGNFPITVSITYADGWILNGSYTLRVRPPAGAPIIGSVIPTWNGTAGTSRNTSLTGTFTDPEAESAVRVSTNLGTMDFILFNTATPATVTNFMSYVNAGKYTDVSFHRSIPSFVIQAGGFKGTGTGSNFSSVVTTPPVVNEPGISNLRGTISMAKVGGDPNSATSQFFVSTNDNSANLDFQNNGFTVFGRVAGNGMAVADAINSLPRATYNLNVNGGAATAFADFPMNAATAPVAMDQTKVVKINSVTSIPTLSFSITGNTNPSVATASIVNGELQITGLSGGQTTITVTATDLDNLITSQNVLVNLTDTFATWAARTAFPNGQNGATQNPDGDALNNLLEYAFLQNPALPNTTTVPTAGSTAISPTTRAMTLQFPVRKFTTGITYSVQANNQLTGTWTEIWNSSQGFAHAQVVSADNQADRTVVTIKDNAVIGAHPKRFLQVKIVQN